MTTKNAMSSGSLLSRRDLLRVGVLGSTGLGLVDLLRSRASAGATGEVTSCILVWLIGGPSHLETYDLKTECPPDSSIASSRSGNARQNSRRKNKPEIERSIVHHEM